MELTRSISGLFPRILRTRPTPPVSPLVMRNISRYTRLVTVCGGMVLLNSIFNPLRPVNWLDPTLIFIASVAVLIGSRIVVRIPGMPSYFSMSETLVFLVMFMFGGDAAIVLAAAAESSASLNFSKKPSTILFNGAASSLATAITVWGLRLSFGPVTELLDNRREFCNSLGSGRDESRPAHLANLERKIFMVLDNLSGRSVCGYGVCQIDKLSRSLRPVNNYPSSDHYLSDL